MEAIEEKEEQPPRGLARRVTYPPELRRKAVRLVLEEGFDIELVTQQMGISESSLRLWLRRYREMGEEGLKDRPRPSRVAKVVKEKIVELKRQDPSLGVRKITHWLRRTLFLSASPETVRRTLQAKDLMVARRPKPKRSRPKPRFFERATPNQMWQSDIYMFDLKGKSVYLIGFIDDHSRYLVGLDVFGSQTTQNVLELYRRAVVEYGAPKEMLTDNGRQYVSWYGKTRFQAELAKGRVHHIRSAPHHPMTLGKIERFWKTIWEEFLVRARFESFEEARERIGLWVKYYNHRRPHQGLGGLCPADRYFAIAKQMREVMEQGLAENLEELALRGTAQSPFYLVGRMGDQSVVIQAQKGQVKMLLDGQPQNTEISHQLEKGENHEHGNKTSSGEQAAEGNEPVQCPGTGAGSVEHLDGATPAERSVPGTGGDGDVIEPVAGPGVGSDPGGNGATDPARPSPTASAEREAAEAVVAPGAATGGQALTAGETARTNPGEEVEIKHEPGTGADVGTASGGVDCGGAQRSVDCHGGGPADGGQPQDVLRMGSQGAGGAGESLGAADGRAAGPDDRSAAGAAAATERATDRAGANAGAEPANPAHPGSA